MRATVNVSYIKVLARSYSMIKRIPEVAFCIVHMYNSKHIEIQSDVCYICTVHLHCIVHALNVVYLG